MAKEYQIQLIKTVYVTVSEDFDAEGEGRDKLIEFAASPDGGGEWETLVALESSDVDDNQIDF